MDKVAGLLLGAGTSTRMGRPKQLLQIKGYALLDHILRETLQSNLDRIILVLGFEAKKIMGTLKTDLRHPKLRIVENEHYAQGISTSIISGLSLVEQDYDQVMIVLGDMPHISSPLINHLIVSYLQSNKTLGAIQVRQRRSHPVIIGRMFYGEVRMLKGDRGAKDLFEQHPDQVCLVGPLKNYDDLDLDTPEDLAAFERTMGSNEGSVMI